MSTARQGSGFKAHSGAAGGNLTREALIAAQGSWNACLVAVITAISPGLLMMVPGASVPGLQSPARGEPV